MPGQRSKGQKLIAFPVDSHLLSLMDDARGARNRSQFIREAITKMLGLPANLAQAPDRVQKIGEIHRLNCDLAAVDSTPKKRAKKKP